MIYLIKTVETYRCANENEAQNEIEEMKKNKLYEISKHKMEKRCLKAKGEIVDEWVRLEVTKEFTSEKEPEYAAKISYSDKEVLADED